MINKIFKNLLRNCSHQANGLSKLKEDKNFNFAICFGVDGVLKTEDKFTKTCSDVIKLVTENRVPYILLSDDHHLESAFSYSISKHCSQKVDYKSIVMLQTPLRDLTSIHNKPILAIGDRKEIYTHLHSVGFNKLTSIDELEAAFDAICDKQFKIPKGLEHLFQQFEGVILWNPPPHWKTSIEMIVNFMLTGGCLSLFTDHSVEELRSKSLNLPKIYVAGSNFYKSHSDPLCRLSHGSFLNLLETAMEKIVKTKMKYEGMFGKPNLSTYLYVDKKISTVYKMTPERIYFIGADPLTDIYGANLYKKACKNSQFSNTEVISYLVSPDTQRGINLQHKISVDSLKILHKSIEIMDVTFFKSDFVVGDALEAVKNILKIERLVD